MNFTRLICLLLVATVARSHILPNPGKPSNSLKPPGLVRQTPSATEAIWLAMIRKLRQYRGQNIKVESSFTINIEEDFEQKPEKESSEAKTSDVGARSLGLGPFLTTPPMSQRGLARRIISTDMAAVQTGDVGICPTQVTAATTVTRARLYRKPERTVDITHAIRPKGMSCKVSTPPTGSPGDECVLAEYPHAAWVRVESKHLNEYPSGTCYPIINTPDFQCHDYVVVPGRCVLKRRSVVRNRTGDVDA